MKAASIRPFTRELRRQGFAFDWCSRSGHSFCRQFKKRIGDREVSVQFWGKPGEADSLFRVSHGDYRPLPNSPHEGYCECTPPVSFKTVAEMKAAVEAEWTRPSGPATEQTTK